jgi:hypothetical protein
MYNSNSSNISKLWLLKEFYPFGALPSRTYSGIHTTAGSQFLYSIELLSGIIQLIVPLTHPPYGSYHTIIILEFPPPHCTHHSRLRHPFTTTVITPGNSPRL